MAFYHFSNPTKMEPLTNQIMVILNGLPFQDANEILHACKYYVDVAAVIKFAQPEPTPVVEG